MSECVSTGVPHDPMHSAAKADPSPACAGRLLRLCCFLLIVSPVLGGCAMSFPMASLLPGDDVTGSNSPVPFGRMLDEEGRRRETAALATALDPQGDGATVKWDNAKSGDRGAITAVGKAYTADGKICRAFISELKQGDTNRKLQGTACTVSAGEWKVSQAKPAKG